MYWGIVKQMEPEKVKLWKLFNNLAQELYVSDL